MGVETTVRPAFVFYNTTGKIDYVVEALKKIPTKR
jgi:selenocysteine lyase/cysteine desulfurase